MHDVPISDYGLIGNTRTAALVSKYGSIDWCCLPKFDSSSFFARLLDENGGHFQISPSTVFSSQQNYLENTNVIETIFTTDTGSVRLLDCFPVMSEEEKRQELSPTHEILRIVEGISGDVRMSYSFKPSPGYGRTTYRMKNVGKYGIRCDYGFESVFLQHNLNSNDSAFEVQKGVRYIFSLSYNNVAPGVIPVLGESAIARIERTIKYWRGWVSKCQYEGEYQKDVRRSALALKLLIYSPSGAIVAAPTTSLPEEISGVRNWDYRYCWLRDASFTIRSLLCLGLNDEARAYMGWILHSTALTRPRLKVVYDLHGESLTAEKELHWFQGYRNSKPVRIGNAADSQFQLDIYGEVMDAICVYAPHMKKFDKDNINFIKGIADSVCELWSCPDEGIWEVRSGQVHHTHSKAMAYLALERFMQLADERKWNIPLEKYHEVAGKIKEDIDQKGYKTEISSFSRSYEDNELDASLLTLPIFLKDWDKEKLESTTIKIFKRLSRNGLTYRYRHRRDGLQGGEGAFGACSFWMVEGLANLGHREKAKDLMDGLLKKENNLGLWPEEMDPSTNEYLGNYPQAFTHTALISAALSLQEKRT